MTMSFLKQMFFTAGAVSLLACSTAFPAPAAQDDTIDAARTGSFTVHKYDMTGAETDGVDLSDTVSDGLANPAAEQALQSYAIEGVEFTYLKVADISTELKDGRLRLIYDIPADLSGILTGEEGTGKTRFTGDTLNEAVRDLFTGESRTASKDLMETYVRSHGGKAMRLTDAEGVTAAEGLPLGLYLIAETKVPENVMSTVDPFFLSLPMTDPTGDRWIYDLSVYPKNQTDRPTLEKEVRSQDDRDSFDKEATASEGDVLDFKVLSRLPSVTSLATYLSRYDYEDIMCEGISYNKDLSIFFFRSSEDAEKEKDPLEVWKPGSDCFSVEYQEADAAGKRHMLVTMTEKGLDRLNRSLPEAVMALRYSGTLISGEKTVTGSDGNPNDITLTWSRTNTEKYDTLTDSTKTYTFGMHLQKTFSDGQGDSEKVQFIMYNETDGYYVCAGKQGKEYFVNGKADARDQAQPLSPGKDGWLDVTGLEAEDDYILEEIQTDAGYTLLRDPVRIHIAADGTASTDGSEAAMVSLRGHEKSAVSLAVRNTRDVDLPRTGGTGTLLFTLAGGAAVLAGLMLIAGGKKRRKDA